MFHNPFRPELYSWIPPTGFGPTPLYCAVSAPAVFSEKSNRTTTEPHSYADASSPTNLGSFRDLPTYKHGMISAIVSYAQVRPPSGISAAQAQNSVAFRHSIRPIIRRMHQKGASRGSDSDILRRADADPPSPVRLGLSPWYASCSPDLFAVPCGLQSSLP